jgi:signal transduction histidine kinase
MGDLARQVTHDIKNGLVPIRHVLRHLSQVERDDPQRVGAIFAERRPTLDASVEYLETLSRNYGRLSRPITLEACDLNDVAREAAVRAAADDRVSIGVRLASPAPIVDADPLLLRRILDNILTNAVDAAIMTGGAVTISTQATPIGGARLLVADTGPGMTKAELDAAFDDFHTTKPTGTGLGLSIVRRLTSDLHATLRVETAPGHGTAVEVGFAPNLPPVLP